jgi:PLP dependent protein
MLVAVSKTFPAESIEEAIDAGQRCFGENRVQEADPKITSLRRRHQLAWHLVGHLQSNKAHRAVELFDVLHSLDSVRLAARLSKACIEIGKSLSVLIQVDLGQEETKFGADPVQVPEIVTAVHSLEGLRLDGLMTMPPYFEDPEMARPYFARLRELRSALEGEQPGCLGQQHLSMGMTHDFETAIQEGATIVRIGTAIFGARTHA